MGHHVLRAFRVIFISVVLFIFTAAAHASNQPPQAGAITPSSGSSQPGAQVTFTTTYSDPDGYQDINAAYLLINNNIAYQNCFLACYSGNRFYLMDDNGAWQAGPMPGPRVRIPPVSPILENSYAQLDCSKTVVSGSGSTLTIKWAVTFKSPFTGTKNSYLYAIDRASAATGWVQKGSIYIINQPPAIGAITPSSGTSSPNDQVSFIATYYDPDGWQNIHRVELKMETSIWANSVSFYAYYDRYLNKLFLANDDGTQWTGGCIPGSQNNIENSYAKLDCSKTTVSGSGNMLTVNWSIVFKPAIAGPKTAYLSATDMADYSTGLVEKGCWMVLDQAPTAGSVSPSSYVPGASSPVIFTTTYTDPDGWRNLNYLEFIITPFTYGPPFGFYNYSFQTCLYAQYYRDANGLYLVNELPRGPYGGYSPGSNNIIENDYVGLDCSKTTVSCSGNTITINWAIVFKPWFTGDNYIYLGAVDYGPSYGDMAQKGTWNIPNRAPSVGNITPASGASLPDQSVTFASTYSDPDGWRNIGSAFLLINSSTSENNCSAVQYNKASGKLYLRSDNGKDWIGYWDPGSNNIIENSYAKLDCSKTTVSGSGTDLVINWAITFKQSFEGSKNLYLKVNDLGGSSIGYTQRGTWLIGVTPNIITTSLPDVIVGKDYEEYLNATGGTPPYTWVIDSGSLPDGLTLDSSTGKISGKPRVVNTFNFTAKVKDANLMTDTQALAIKVAPYIMGPDEQLLDETEAKAALYFYNEVLSNGFVKDGSAKDFSSIAATGFGLASLCVMADRCGTSANWTVTPAQARARVNQILDECIRIQSLQTPGNYDYGTAGFLYHFITDQGTQQGGSEISTIDMALFLAGAVTAGEYFGCEVKTKAEQIYSKLDWSYFYVASKKQFSHGCYYGGSLISGTWDRPGDEAILVSLLSVGSDPNNGNFLRTMYSWPRVVGQYGGYKVVNSYFGSIFTYIFAHCYFDFAKLGKDNPLLAASPADPVDWWANSVAAAYANRQFCIDQSATYASYGPDSWGITACEYPAGGYAGLLGAAPCEYNNGNPSHDGTIAPYGAISSMPLVRTAPDEKLSDNLAFKSLKYYHDTYYNNLWGPYGPRDSFDSQGRFDSNYLGIDVGPEVLMIENYRTGFLWNNFMNNDRIKAATAKVFGPGDIPPAKTSYVSAANAADPNQDGSQAHPFDSIQKAADASGGGNVVINIAPGQYGERVTITSLLRITLKGTVSDRNDADNPQKNTVMRNGVGGSPVSIDIANSRDMIIDSIVVAGDGSHSFATTYVGIQVSDSRNVTIKNCIVQDTGEQRGGAGGVSVGGSGIVVSDNIIRRNEGHYVAGLYVGGSGMDPSAQILRNDVIGNHSWASNAGITVAGFFDAIIKNNRIYGNHADWSAGLITCSTNAEIKNNLLVNNGIDYPWGGGLEGILSSDANSQIINNTVINGELSVGGSSIIKNNIINGAMRYGGTSLTADHNDVYYDSPYNYKRYYGCGPGVGSISEPPLFIAPDTDGDPDNDDYHLQPFSPCINSGDPASEYNDKDGTLNDMGIYGGPDSIYAVPRFLNVPQDYASIQAAINAAVKGDVIKIAAGVYQENVTLNKSGVILAGDNRSSIIKADPGLSAVYCENINNDMTLLYGLTLMGQYGVRCAGNVSSLRIEDNSILVSETAPVDRGYGVYLEDGASSFIAHNNITNCGRAIYGAGNNDLSTIENVIDNCRMPGGGGIFLVGPALGKYAAINGNSISRCLDGAVSIYNVNSGQVIGNKILNNDSTTTAAAINVSGLSGSLKIANNIIGYGHATGSGHAGIFIDRSSEVTVANNIFYRNTGANNATSGSAASFVNTAGTVANNIFIENSNCQSVVYNEFQGYCASIFYNDFWNNAATNEVVYVNYNIIPPPVYFHADPLFIGTDDFHLKGDSLCIDAGYDDSEYMDIDWTRNDMGIYGGPTPYTLD